MAIYKIDLGNMPREKATKYIDEIFKKIKEKEDISEYPVKKINIDNDMTIKERNAKKWAEFFMNSYNTNPKFKIDEETMMAWFLYAIENEYKRCTVIQHIEKEGVRD